MTRISVGAAAASVLLLVVGCSSEPENNDGLDADTPSSSQASSGTPSTATSTQTSEATSSTADYPVPPGAEGWPVKDIAACSDLGAITEPELVVRVPVATPECIRYPENSDVLVIATGQAQVGFGKETRVDVPGFDGEVRSIRTPISRGAAYSAKPSDGDVTWLVLWDGGTGSPIGQILEDLLVSS